MARKRKGDPVSGWVNFDKPLGMTSTQAVGRIRRLLNAQKVGHAGTLDPLANGVLPIALGEATKTVPFMMEAVKAYEVQIVWGQARDTCDAEGEVIETSEVRPQRLQIEAVLAEFTGIIDQVPPRFSAIKIDGKRAYDLARAGEVVKMKSRKVRIESIEILDTCEENARFRVICGKGTYIRSLARDMAKALGTVGYVGALRRTRVGGFVEETVFSLDVLENLHYEGRVLESLRPVETALDDIPVMIVTDQDANDLKYGRAIGCPEDFANSEWVLVKDASKALALCQPRDGHLAPKRVFNL